MTELRNIDRQERMKQLTDRSDSNLQGAALGSGGWGRGECRKREENIWPPPPIPRTGEANAVGTAREGGVEGGGGGGLECCYDELHA
jgi:hypothetical protein